MVSRNKYQMTVNNSTINERRHRNGRHSHSHGMRRRLCPNEVHRGGGYRMCRQGHRGRSLASSQGDLASCCVRDPFQNCGCEVHPLDHLLSGRYYYRELRLRRMNGRSCS